MRTWRRHGLRNTAYPLEHTSMLRMVAGDSGRCLHSMQAEPNLRLKEGDKSQPTLYGNEWMQDANAMPAGSAPRGAVSRAPVAFAYGPAAGCPNEPASSLAPASPLLCATLDATVDGQSDGQIDRRPPLGSPIVARGVGQTPHPKS